MDDEKMSVRQGGALCCAIHMTSLLGSLRTLPLSLHLGFHSSVLHTLQSSRFCFRWRTQPAVNMTDVHTRKPLPGRIHELKHSTSITTSSLVNVLSSARYPSEGLRWRCSADPIGYIMMEEVSLICQPNLHLSDQSLYELCERGVSDATGKP